MLLATTRASSAVSLRFWRLALGTEAVDSTTGEYRETDRVVLRIGPDMKIMRRQRPFVFIQGGPSGLLALDRNSRVGL